jgi:hypothetical protein
MILLLSQLLAMLVLMALLVAVLEASYRLWVVCRQGWSQRPTFGSRLRHVYR